MNVVHLPLSEFERLQRDAEDRLIWQGKPYAKGDAVSKRVLRRMIEYLDAETDASLSCLVVDMEECYCLWHEIQLIPALDDRAVPAPDQAGVTPLRLSDRQPDKLATLAALLADQMLIKLRVRNEATLLEPSVDTLKALSADLANTPELAQELFAKLEETGAIAQLSQLATSEPVIEAAQLKQKAPQPSRPRKYRGIRYDIEKSVPIEQTESQSAPQPRKYRGVSY